MMKIGEKIRVLREKYRLKQVDLANSLHVSPQAVSKWEHDENFPDIYLLKQIAMLFDVSLDYLLGMHEEQSSVFEATVFCSSLNQFAEKGKAVSADELAEWTNRVFYHMTECVLKHNGIPVKYTGDGFLCFFAGQHHADRALVAACDMEREINDKHLVMFLHAGDIYFGRIGHPDYASKDIYGNAVNQGFLAMNALPADVKSGIVISDAVKHLLKEIPDSLSYSRITVSVLNEAMKAYVLSQRA